MAVSFAPQNSPLTVVVQQDGEPVSALAPRYCSLSTRFPLRVANPQWPYSDPFALSTRDRALRSKTFVAPIRERLSIAQHQAFSVHSQTVVRLLLASLLQPANAPQRSASIEVHCAHRPE